jgi:DUF1365 family protein
MEMEPALFVGTLHHRRHTPVRHAFRYPVFMAYLDLARLSELMDVSPFTSYNRFNWASFDDRDHFGDPARPLLDRVRQSAIEAGIELPDGPVFLLTHLRYAGYCFNPVSFYYAFDRAGVLKAMLAEVNNTVGGSHNYWLTPEANATTFRASARKAFYVSPLLPSTLQYRFTVAPPQARAVVHIDAFDGDTRCFDATLSLERRPWSAGDIHRQLARHPLMTAEVIGAIHWQALKLWWKGARPPVEQAS